jgi:hypothetical protein
MTAGSYIWRPEVRGNQLPQVIEIVPTEALDSKGSYGRGSELPEVGGCKDDLVSEHLLDCGSVSMKAAAKKQSGLLYRMPSRQLYCCCRKISFDYCCFICGELLFGKSKYRINKVVQEKISCTKVKASNETLQKAVVKVPTIFLRTVEIFSLFSYLVSYAQRLWSHV